MADTWTGLLRIRRLAAHVLAGPALGSVAPDSDAGQSLTARTCSGSQQTDFDCVVIGAGFAGMYVVKRLRDQGFSVRCFERGSDVGGTWYWNRYPGARCDIESMQYSYQFDPQLEQEWEWSERYSPQPEILKYASHVADRFDLRRNMLFDTEVVRMVFDEAACLWTVETDREPKSVKARFVICATGCLSHRNDPANLFKGFEEFEGRSFHTGEWPHADALTGARPLGGQRVAVIGTGSSGVQSIPEIAKVAEHLYVFQRTANYTIPAYNKPADSDYVRKVKADYRRVRARAWKSPSGFIVPEVEEHESAVVMSPTMSASEEERRALYERNWVRGGLSFLASYADIMVSEEANAVAANFVKDKIRQIVKDPATANRLCPKSFIGCKRLCADSGYFETFNRPNVTLVDISSDGEGSTPIEKMTKKGVLTRDGTEYAVDAIVFAVGYDAMTGAILNIETIGTNGLRLQDAWKNGPRSYMGLQISGFPNLFTVTGPGSPSVFTNMLPSIEQHVNWIVDALAHLRSQGYTCMAAQADAEASWMQHCQKVGDFGLRGSPACRSWYTGDNVAGKPRVLAPYSGGLDLYTKKLENVTQNNYRGYDMS